MHNNNIHHRRANRVDPPTDLCTPSSASDTEAARGYGDAQGTSQVQHPNKKNANLWIQLLLVFVGGIAFLVLLCGIILSSGSRILLVGGGGKNGSRSLAKLEPDTKKKYPHDHPNHPWHWTRENMPGPALGHKKDCNNMSYSSMYDHFHEYGYVIFTSCSLKKNEASGLKPAQEYTKSTKRARVLNAKNRAVREVSLDSDTMELIEYMHGSRRTFPFQTLNFPTGTQQPIHSDLIHFDTMPRTLMTAAWTALEDMSEDNGPLKFYPRSHHLGTHDWDEIGLRQKQGPKGISEDDNKYFGTFYGEELAKYLERAGLKPKIAADMKYGQTFIWAAGLAHGGSQQKNHDLTRLSQVTHYFFEGADYYWIPRLSDLTKGKIRYTAPNIVSCKASAFAPTGLHRCADGHIEKWKRDLEEAEL